MDKKDFRYLGYKDIEYKSGNTVVEELVGILVSMLICGALYLVIR